VEDEGAQVPADEVQEVPIVKPLGRVMTRAVLEAMREGMNGDVIVRVMFDGVSTAMFWSLFTLTEVKAAETKVMGEAASFSIAVKVLV
jgi:hypothetical protein